MCLVTNLVGLTNNFQRNKEMNGDYLAKTIHQYIVKDVNSETLRVLYHI